ncbi:MAG: plasmid stabilization protein [Flavobacteriaceae bacterium]|nr:plasmid stabilization protein [Flavobacteriaceae bacterium]
MKVQFLKSFLKDVKKIKEKSILNKLKLVIFKMEETNSIYEIPETEKLKGFSNAYRTKIGKYRLGFYFENDCIELARFVKRNDIYELFPK